MLSPEVAQMRSPGRGRERATPEKTVAEKWLRGCERDSRFRDDDNRAIPIREELDRLAQLLLDELVPWDMRAAVDSMPGREATRVTSKRDMACLALLMFVDVKNMSALRLLVRRCQVCATCGWASNVTCRIQAGGSVIITYSCFVYKAAVALLAACADLALTAVLSV
jgi:hypothetical protein